MSEKPSSPEKKKRRDSTGRRVLRRILIILVATVLLTLAGFHLFFLITSNEVLSAPGDTVSNILTPLQAGFAQTVDGFVAYLYRLKLRATLEIEYNNLKAENERLVYQAMLVEDLERKLKVYENLYDEISVNETMNPLVATVIMREAGNYFSVFDINKGANDGVEDFMAVTMDGALIGYTYNVTATKSTVRTIIDSEASIAGLISSTRDQGTVRGTLGIDGQAMCRMFYLPEDHLPRPGDMVVTSGVGLSFPKGIPIGTVRESTRGMESNKQYIVVEPRADFQHIEEVIVLRYKPLAEAVEERVQGGEGMLVTPLGTPLPIPTIQIGSDFYQLAPTPEPTPEPSLAPDATIMDGTGISVTPGPTRPPATGGYEYQVPDGVETGPAYGYTLAPTASPTPTPVPLELTIEED